MKKYMNHQNLIEEIKNSFKKYDAEFETIPESKKDFRIEGVDKTPSENISYQIGWLTLLLKWESLEKDGIEVITPKPEYKWNNLGNLYQEFYKNYGRHTLSEQRGMLFFLVERICEWIETLSEEELFEPKMRKWATTKAMWPIYKWIHINTVAPFTNFRTKIRKWKKLSE